MSRRTSAAATKPPPKPAGKSKTPARPFNAYAKAASTVTSAGLRGHRHGNDIFGYSMSSAEYGAIELADRNGAMRRANSEHRMLLQQTDSHSPLGHKAQPHRNAREQYLSARSLVTPRDKYNYPEATSWRIGWVRSIPEEATTK